jgi:hypothetical protein
LRVRFAERVEDPVFSVSLANSQRKSVLVATSSLETPDSGTFAVHEEVTVRFGFDNVLAPDRYSATPSIARRGSGQAWIDWRKDLVDVAVSATRTAGGMINLPVRNDVERTTAAPTESTS